MPSLPRWATPRLPGWFVRLYRQPGRFALVVLGLPVVLACGWIASVGEREWRHRERADLLMAAQLAARLIEEELERLRHIEAAVVEQPAFVQATRRRDEDALMDYLQLLLRVHPMISTPQVLTPEGLPIVQWHTPLARGEPGEALTARVVPTSLATASTPLAPPMPASTSGVSGVFVADGAQGEKAVLVTTPIQDGEELVGLLQTEYRLEELGRWLAKVRVEPAGFLYVVDQEGLVVAHPFQLLPGEPKNAAAWTPVALTAASPDARVIRFRQGSPQAPWTAAVVPLPSVGWRVIVQQPDAAMLAPLARVIGSYVAIIGGLLLAAGVLLLWWTRVHQAMLTLVADQAQLLTRHHRQQVSATLRRRSHTTRDPQP